MGWPLSDNITVSLISGLGTVAAAFFAWRVKQAFKRDDIAAAGLTAQIGGWKELTDQIREYADDLDDRLQRASEDCDKRVAAVEREMRWLDDQCQRKLAALEQRLSHVEKDG